MPSFGSSAPAAARNNSYNEVDFFMKMEHEVYISFSYVYAYIVYSVQRLKQIHMYRVRLYTSRLQEQKPLRSCIAPRVAPGWVSSACLSWS